MVQVEHSIACVTVCVRTVSFEVMDRV